MKINSRLILVEAFPLLGWLIFGSVSVFRVTPKRNQLIMRSIIYTGITKITFRD